MKETPQDASAGPLVLRERHDAVELLTLNRPERRNALGEPMREALITAVDDAAARSEVLAVVITGAGDRAFAAGADIRELAARSPIQQRRVMLERRVYDVVAAVPKPVIAAVNGACLGGGLELALAADVRVAAAGATFGQPEVRLGLIPGGGATQRLPRVVGVGAALKLVMSGEAIGADEALRLGLVDEVVPAPEVVPRALALAGRMAANGPLAVLAAKQAVRAALDVPLAAGLSFERALFLATFASEDREEGTRAFLEKRQPEFRGR
jgi:enoyl-CoA hydratase